MSQGILSVRLPLDDQGRLAELVARLGSNPSDVVRQLLRAAVPEPSPRFVPELGDDDPADRETMPPSAPHELEEAAPDTQRTGHDPRQLEIEDALMGPPQNLHRFVAELGGAVLLPWEPCDLQGPVKVTLDRGRR